MTRYAPRLLIASNRATQSATDAMHGSSASLRPRQRTSTSCTECRRRKQKCNQAKDRPCNNCARRYPPVVCTYESSRRSSTIERVIDLQGGSGTASRDEDLPSSGPSSTYLGANTAYELQPSSGGRDFPVAAETEISSTGSHPFYAPLETRTNYWQQQDDPWSSQNLTTSSSSVPLSGGYYQSVDSYGYGSAAYADAEHNYGGYYSSVQANDGEWLSANGDPAAFVGTGTAYDAFNDLPIDASRRNAELFHFFHQSLSPFFVTIDGKDPPAMFYQEWTPWIVQSPLMSSLTLLSSSCYQSEARGLNVAKCQETIAIKGKIISLINDYLKKKRLKEVNYDAIAAVMYLAMNEWYFGDDASFWAHMKGLKEMLRLRGGIECLPPDSLLRKQIILNDYQIACAFERDLFLLKDSKLDQSIKALDPYPNSLENPLLQSEIRIIDVCLILDISQAAGEILDDMKFLTSSIVTLRSTSPTSEDLLKFQATALWTHNRISALPSSNQDLIYETLRLTAILYSTAILFRKPLSLSSTAAELKELGAKMWRTSLSRWKQIPGVLLWIVLVACPCPDLNGLQKKYLKMMIGTVAMCIGVYHHDVAVACMRGFLEVQRWIEDAEKDVEEVFEEKGKGKGKGKAIGGAGRSRARRTSVAGEGSSREVPESSVVQLWSEIGD